MKTEKQKIEKLLIGQISVQHEINWIKSILPDLNTAIQPRIACQELPKFISDKLPSLISNVEEALLDELLAGKKLHLGGVELDKSSIKQPDFFTPIIAAIGNFNSDHYRAMTFKVYQDYYQVLDSVVSVNPDKVKLLIENNTQYAESEKEILIYNSLLEICKGFQSLKANSDFVWDMHYWSLYVATPLFAQISFDGQTFIPKWEYVKSLN